MNGLDAGAFYFSAKRGRLKDEKSEGVGNGDNAART